MTWVDIALIALLALSVAVGLWRGLVYEVMALAGWLVAYLAAPWLAPVLQGFLPVERMKPELVGVAALVMAFVLVLVAWSIGAKLVRLLIHATPLSLIDRVLGAGFGTARALLVGLLMVFVVGLTPARAWPAWQDSQAVPWLQAVLTGVSPLLPDSVAKLISQS